MDFATRSPRHLNAGIFIFTFILGGGAYAMPRYFVSTSAWNAPIPSTAKYCGHAAASYARNWVMTV
jgi:hypothetical protein